MSFPSATGLHCPCGRLLPEHAVVQCQAGRTLGCLRCGRRLKAADLVQRQAPDFDGAVYDPALDKARLSKQIGRVYAAMRDGVWRTLEEIKKITSDPHASISAQVRHLRKRRSGSYVIEKQHRGNNTQGFWEYRLLGPGGQVIAGTLKEEK